jgi:hypothetical protein
VLPPLHATKWTEQAAPSREPRAHAPKPEPSGPIILLDIRGMGTASGRHPVMYRPGWTVRRYLEELGLWRYCQKARVLDLQHPERGRRKFSYQPSRDSRIAITSPSLSTAQRFQRSDQDAQELARNMGKEKEVRRDIRYKESK